LPKGHIKKGESEIECAFRELEEETGIARSDVSVVDGFRFENTYCPNKRTEKTVVLFAGLIAKSRPIILTPEHTDYAWLAYRPPHDLREFPTIHNALLAWHSFGQQRIERLADRGAQA
jgi:8-oxo-dGTP pyrophosphatase MutT (NUDIX family)